MLIGCAVIVVAANFLASASQTRVALIQNAFKKIGATRVWEAEATNLLYLGI